MYCTFVRLFLGQELVEAEKNKDCPESPFDVERSPLVSADSRTSPLSAQALAQARAERKISESTVSVPESPADREQNE